MPRVGQFSSAVDSPDPAADNARQRVRVTGLWTISQQPASLCTAGIGMSAPAASLHRPPQPPGPGCPASPHGTRHSQIGPARRPAWRPSARPHVKPHGPGRSWPAGSSRPRLRPAACARAGVNRWLLYQCARAGGLFQVGKGGDGTGAQRRTVPCAFGLVQPLGRLREGVVIGIPDRPTGPASRSSMKLQRTSPRCTAARNAVMDGIAADRMSLPEPQRRCLREALCTNAVSLLSEHSQPATSPAKASMHKAV
jgi:hypothetical protein